MDLEQSLASALNYFKTESWVIQVFIIVFASLQSLPEEQIEASKIDGAGKLRQLQYVILPHLKTSIALAAVLSGAYNFSLFDLTFLLTGGGPAG